ncbi:MAG: PD-(D/E)XK nuclease family protein [Candidatus Nanoarchaeia archaeon]|nr:PD-(D/E)XK nuclease family protein [Candidatus Nanoarchaeia archaeon]
MNIFTVLSQGNGRLDEENHSAIIGYFLKPYETHGLSDAFLKKFLTLVGEGCEDRERFENVCDKNVDIDINFEVPYKIGDKTRKIDIQIQVFSKEDEESENRVPIELHRIGIENKINMKSIDNSQFLEEFLGLKEDIGNNDTKITMVFITPEKNPKIESEFSALTEEILGKHKACWLEWYSKSNNKYALVPLLMGLLQDEADVKINPLTEYLRHTLKAFIYHVKEEFTPDLTMKKPKNLGDVIDDVEVKINVGTYWIVRFEHGTVKVFDMNTAEEQVAKPILREINKEKELKINLFRENGNEINTRELGKQIILKLNECKKTLELNKINNEG